MALEPCFLSRRKPFPQTATFLLLLQGNPAEVSGHLYWQPADSPNLFPCHRWVAEIGTWGETGTSLPKGWRRNSSTFWNISWTSNQRSADASAEATWVFSQAGRGIRGTTAATLVPGAPGLAPVTWKNLTGKHQIWGVLYSGRIWVQFKWHWKFVRAESQLQLTVVG